MLEKKKKAAAATTKAEVLEAAAAVEQQKGESVKSSVSSQVVRQNYKVCTTSNPATVITG